MRQHSAENAGGSMLRLRTFGGLSIEGKSQPLKGAARQRKPLALLALLAGSGRSGLSRDRLSLLLWPESNSEQARNLLKQRLFHLRRDLNAPELVIGTVQLRLNPDVISTDVEEFDTALERGDLPKAAALYSGPFLDGFHVGDSVEFDRWLAERQEYFAQSADKLLQRLAEIAESEGNSDESIQWWRRRSLLQPLDSKIAAGVVRALAASGDIPSALRHLHTHEAQLRDELGLPLAGDLAHLAERLRAECVVGNDSVGHDSARSRSSTHEQPPVVAPTLPETPALPNAVTPTVPAQKSRRNTHWIRSGRWQIAILIVVATLGPYLLWVQRDRSRAPGSPVSESVVAVFPFSVQGNASDTYLREGVPDLLNIRLNGAGRLRSTDPRALAGVAGATAPKVINVSAGRDLSRKIGAGQFVLGDAIESGGSLQLVARLYDSGGLPTGQAEVDGRPSQLAHLVDQLATRLLASVYKAPGERLMQTAALTTSSFPALKAYLVGEQEFRAGHYAAAADAFQHAVTEDTAFALAYYRLSVAAEWAPWSGELIDAAAARADKYASRLPSRDKDLFAAFLSRRRGDFDDAERRYRTIVSLYPDELEAWYQLGEIQFHYDPLRGLPLSAAKQPFDRVMFLRPGDTETLAHLLRIAALARDRAAVDSITHRLLVLSPSAALSPGFIAFRAAALGDTVGLARGFAALSEAGDEAVSVTMRHVGTYVQDFGAAERIASILEDRKRAIWYRAVGYGAAASFLLAQGHVRAANAALQRHDGFDPDWSLELRGIFAALPFLPLSSDAMDSLRRALVSRRAVRPMRVPPGDALSTGWDVRIAPYALGLLAARSNDASAALTYASQLKREPGSAADSAFLKVLSATVAAEVARSQGRPAEALRLLGSELPEGTLAFLGGGLGCQVYQRYLRAELLRESGRDADALRWYASLAQTAPYEAAFLAPAHLREAQVYDRLGQTAAAIQHYGYFIALWRDADPELRPLVVSAANRIAQLKKR